MNSFGEQPPPSGGGEDILEREVRIPAGGVVLSGTLTLQEHASGVVVFAHGSGSSRFSPRNRAVARTLNEAKLATLLFDLLTRDEEAVDDLTGHLRFDIPFLAERLEQVTDWLRREPTVRDLPIGYFGSSTGGGAALVAAAAEPEHISAVVSRGGRPDLAGSALHDVRAPTLLIVGGEDDVVIELNHQAMKRMRCDVKLDLVPGATHLFEEPGTLERVAQLASDWFVHHFSLHMPVEDE